MCGQQLDLLGHDDITIVNDLKTRSCIGALLGDASDQQLRAIEPLAIPLGLAFQLRDDLLGSFGSSRATGKRTGSDLRQGKNTALIAAARDRFSAIEHKLLDEVLGNRAASSCAIEALTQALEGCGARTYVEAMLDQRLDQARAALTNNTTLAPEGAAICRRGRAMIS